MDWLVAFLVVSVVTMAVLVCVGAALALRRSQHAENLRFETLARLVEDSHDKVMSSSDCYLDLRRIAADVQPLDRGKRHGPEAASDNAMNLEIRPPTLDGSIN